MLILKSTGGPISLELKLLLMKYESLLCGLITI